MQQRKYFLVFALLALATCARAQKPALYVARDLTAENLFSENIEGPVVDKKGRLFVVNFQKDGTIGEVSMDGSVKLHVTLPQGSTGNALMLDKSGSMFVADWTGHNVLKIDPVKKAVTVFCHSDKFNQPNDLTVNKNDQLFASDPNWKDGTGKLWRVEKNGELVLIKDNMGTTNGIELSPDEKILYVNESLHRRLWAFDVDKKGNISNQRLFYEFPDFGLDGMKCDNRGNLYVTRHGKGTIAILSPDGKLLREVTMKGKLTSNIAFGGKDGKDCFVTLQDRKCVETFRSEYPGRKYK